MNRMVSFVKYTQECQWHVYFTVYDEPVVNNILQSSSSLTLIVFEYLKTDEFTVTEAVIEHKDILSKCFDMKFTRAHNITL